MGSLKGMRNRNQGFTLIEMMAVLALLGILAMVAVPLFTDHIKNSQIAADNANAKIIQNSIQKAIAKEKLSLPLTDSASTMAQIGSEFDPFPVCQVEGNKWVVTINSGKVEAKSSVSGGIEFELAP